MADQSIIDEFKPYIDYLKNTLSKQVDKIKLQKRFDKVASESDNSLLLEILEIENEFGITFDEYSSSLAASSEVSKGAPVLEKTNKAPAIVEASEDFVSPGITSPFLAPSSSAAAGGEGVVAEGAVAAGPLLLPVIEKPTLSQGDCFYSSIYRAAGEGGLLPNIQTCFGVRIDTEDNFIEDFRGLIGVKILTSPDAESIYDTLVTSITESKGGRDYTERLKAYPTWFQKAFREGLPKKEIFLKRLATFSSTRNNDVSEIEVTLVENMLKECGIPINKQNHEIARGIRGALNIWNKGEYHWVYFSFNIPEGYVKTEKFINLEYEECIRKCKLERNKKISEAKHYIEYEAWKKNPKSKPHFQKRVGYVYDGEMYNGLGGAFKKRKTPRRKINVSKSKRFKTTRSK